MYIFCLKYYHFYSHTPCGVQLLILKYLKLYPDFYSHTPCGVQQYYLGFLAVLNPFLLTHPLRGATSQGQPQLAVPVDFYSHTPCGVQPSPFLISDHIIPISTHTPLAGCNRHRRGRNRAGDRFLLTHPLRGATTFLKNWGKRYRISTHTPLAGCNLWRGILHHHACISTHTPLAGCNEKLIITQTDGTDFYSHTPCGVQQPKLRNSLPFRRFLLTHPLRGATQAQAA